MSTYTFLPWVRHGLSGFIQKADDLHDVSIDRANLNVEISLKDDAEPLNKEVVFGGPGDVIGIQPQAIIKNHPATGTTEFDPNLLAFVEFYDEDFPWRYTPAMPLINTDKLRPWLMLLVLKENEFTWLTDSRPLSAIRVTAPVLDMDPEESWAWAHAQIDEKLMSQDTDGNSISDEKALEALFSTNPDAALSRVLCPRRLEPEQQYFAFLVPAFEVGRLAGIGEDFTTTPIQKVAWSIGEKDVSFPFYHHFSFATGEDVGFETLARKLKPQSVNKIVTPSVNVVDLFEELGVPSTNNFPTDILSDDIDLKDKYYSQSTLTTIPIDTQIEGSKELRIESALVPPSHQHKWYGENNKTDRLVRTALIDQLNEAENLQQISTASTTEDPTINIPPLYARWHAAQNNLEPVNGSLQNSNWFQQLNLDPAYRIAAGIGVDIVKEKQDVFMQQAWEQVGEIREANQQLRQVELGKEVATNLFQKHVASRNEEQVLGMTYGLHGKIEFDNSNTKTIYDKITTSTLPNASLDPAFTKLIRKRGPFAKKVNKQLGNGEELQAGIITKIADNSQNSTNLEVAPATQKKIDAAVLMNQQEVNNLEIAIQGNTDFDSNFKYQVSELKQTIVDQAARNAAINALKVDFAATAFSQSKIQLDERIQPLRSIPKQTLSNLDLDLAINSARIPEESSLKTIMAHPEFEQPTFAYLAEKYPDFIAPAIGQMKENSVSLMKINQPFIESFLIGMSHEMGNELLWREFPTDQRGNYFKQFWDTGEYLNEQLIPENPEDISPITSWNENSSLGSHSISQIDQDGKVVFLMKGELIKQYPNLVLFAQKATWQNGIRVLDDPNHTANVVFPLFRIPLKDNLVALAFHLTTNQVTGDLLADGNPDPAGDAGWFFMFKERMGELKFGLDADSDPATVPTSITTNDISDNLHWGQVINATSSIKHMPLGAQVSLADGYHWGTNSADMACILQQKPFFIGFHASSLINQ